MTSRIALILALLAGLAIWVLVMVSQAKQIPPPTPYVATLSSDAMSETVGEKLEGKCVRLDEGRLETGADGTVYLRFNSGSGWPVAQFLVRNPLHLSIGNSDLIIGTLGRLPGSDQNAKPSLWTIDVTAVEPFPPPPQAGSQRIFDAFSIGFICVVGIGAAVAVFHWRKRRRVLKLGERSYLGQCTNCGYDLRASAERCPECGHVI
jgi:hypothetical protein